MDCGIKKTKKALSFTFTCYASCNCCHYFPSKARLIRGPDMILQEVRGECIASGVSVILAFCRETFECHKTGWLNKKTLWKQKELLLILLTGYGINMTFLKFDVKSLHASHKCLQISTGRIFFRPKKKQKAAWLGLVWLKKKSVVRLHVARLHQL